MRGVSLCHPISKAQETVATHSTRRLPPLVYCPSRSGPCEAMVEYRLAQAASVFPFNFDLDFITEFAASFLTPAVCPLDVAIDRYHSYSKISRVRTLFTTPRSLSPEVPSRVLDLRPCRRPHLLNPSRILTRPEDAASIPLLSFRLSNSLVGSLLTLIILTNCFS